MGVRATAAASVAAEEGNSNATAEVKWNRRMENWPIPRPVGVPPRHSTSSTRRLLESRRGRAHIISTSLSVLAYLASLDALSTFPVRAKRVPENRLVRAPRKTRRPRRTAELHLVTRQGRSLPHVGQARARGRAQSGGKHHESGPLPGSDRAGARGCVGFSRVNACESSPRSR